MAQDIRVVGDQRIHFPIIGGSDSSPFSPDQIAGLQVWFDASDLSTLWQNEAGTTPAVADNDPIGRWSDKSSNLWFLTSPNALPGGDPTNRPSLQTNEINGFSVVRMNGVNSFLRRVSSLAITGSSVTVFVVSKRIAFVDANEAILSLAASGVGDNDNDNSAVIGLSPGVPNATVLFDHRNEVDLTALSHPANGVPFIYTSKYNGTNQTGYINGVAGIPIGSSNNFNSIRLCIGFRNTDVSIDRPNNRDYAEILIYNSALSNTNRQAVETYLTDKWAI